MTEKQLRLLVRLESYKAHDLEVNDATLKKMADLCRELARNPSVDSMTQREALTLATEVAELQGPPKYNHWREQRLEQHRALRIQMAFLLTRESQFLLASRVSKICP